MTSISGLSQPMSPRAMMDSRINAAVEAGSISETDEAALETALDAIDSALASATSGSTSRLDPSEMKERIDSLIEQQVSDGTLTEDQASELQALFAQGGPPPEGMEGMAGMAGMSGMEGMPPPPPPPPGASDETSSSTETEDISVDQLNAMIAFLENLRSSIAANSDTYSATSSSSTTDSSGLVVDSVA